jgi:hypothetical protein
MAINSPAPPIGEPIAQKRRKDRKEGQDPLEGLISDAWADWYSQQQQQLATFAARINSVALTAQAASIAATDMTGGTLNAGLYRLDYYFRITQGAGSSSSLELTIDWEDHGEAISHTFPAETGNTTTDFQSDGFPLFYVDALSPVRYATTYASSGLQIMTYQLYIVLTQVQA